MYNFLYSGLGLSKLFDGGDPVFHLGALVQSIPSNRDTKVYYKVLKKRKLILSLYSSTRLLTNNRKFFCKQLEQYNIGFDRQQFIGSDV